MFIFGGYLSWEQFFSIVDFYPGLLTFLCFLGKDVLHSFFFFDHDDFRLEYLLLEVMFWVLNLNHRLVMLTNFNVFTLVSAREYFLFSLTFLNFTSSLDFQLDCFFSFILISYLGTITNFHFLHITTLIIEFL